MSKADQVLSSVYDGASNSLKVLLSGDSINVDLSGVTITVRPDPNIAASFDSDNNRIRVGLPENLITEDGELKVTDSQLADVITAIRESMGGGGSTRSQRPIAAVRDIDENGNVSIKDYVIKQDACIFNQIEVVNV